MAASMKGSLPVTPRDDWFDRLAQSAARNGTAGRDASRGRISRRDAVGVFAGTTAMAMIASWVKPRPALGATPAVANDPGCAGIRTFYKEGCSNPVPKLNFKPNENGCGPQNGFNAVPQTPLGMATFTPACNEHDRGYATCNRPKAVTDTKFLADMKTICAGPGTPVTGFVMNLLLYQCIRNAEIFYTAVSELGDDPYKEGQAESCDCCMECANGAPKCNGICCRAANWVCGSSGLCCEDCAPGWHKCPYPKEKRCGFGCCRPDDGVCCPGVQPGDLRCCSPKGKGCFKGGCG
jgi:hypothetical protein